MTRPFVHLHVHSHYSLLDGAAKIPDLVRTAKEYEMPALALTDHGNLFAALEFYNACQKMGIKPIVGYEAYIAPNSMLEKDKERYHLTLLAKNYEGYRNLMILSSEAFLSGFYYKPRIDKELLAKHSQGLIILSGCLASEACQNILKKDMQKARESIAFYRDLMGDDFYIELQRNKLEDQEIANQGLLSLSKEFNIPLVFTNDVHYLKKEDWYAHEILLCIQTATTINDPNRFRFQTQEYYMKTSEEMYQQSQDFPRAAENTVAVADKVNLEFPKSENHLPFFACPDNLTNEEYLRILCEKGLKERYGEITPTVRERFEMEFNVICKMGFATYFLIVWDFVNYARCQNISVGPGRGSAAGSIISYSLYITNLDPLKYNLLFERFLNEGRNEMPDIDIDFETVRRGEVIDYVTKKYGERQVSQIITFGTMAARGVIRDVGRVLEISLAECDTLSKKVPNDLNITLEKALESEEFKQAYEENENAKKIIDIAIKLEGLNRQPGTHAAGVIISDQDLTEYCPLYKINEGLISTQYEKEHMEDLGLLKMDFLGLSTLTVIENNLKMIKKMQGIDIDIDKIPLNDKATYDMLCQGETKGVFQLESDGMTNLVKKMRPDRFEDLIALVALFRPGPLGCGMVDSYCDCKHGRETPNYMHPILKDILEETYGVILYQEQVMQIARTLSGFTLSEADFLRKAMGKKKLDIMLSYKSKFIEGAKQIHNISEELSTAIFENIEQFSGYGFNKSHSAAYGLVSYQTAYLKAHFPKEFMASLMTNECQNIDKIVKYIHECEDINIKLLPPDINESNGDFTPTKDGIRFGLAALKGVGEKAIEPIETARKKVGKFESIYHMCENIDTRLVNKQVLESLTKSGALDGFGKHRSQIMAVIPDALKIGANIQKEQDSLQMNLFDFGDIIEDMESLQQQEKYPDIPEWTDKEKQQYEKEIIGFYMTSHPLEKWKHYLSMLTTPIQNLNPKSRSAILVAGMITSLRETQIKQGKLQGRKMISRATLDDGTSTCLFTCFPDMYEKNQDTLVQDKIVFLLAHQDEKVEDSIQLIVDDVFSADEGIKKQTETVTIQLQETTTEQDLEILKSIITKHHGNCRTYLEFEINGNPTKIHVSEQFYVNMAPNFLHDIEKNFGKTCLTLKNKPIILPKKKWERKKKLV
ncbi:MAG TPA: DNA polymerase III subunit alpha [Planctomycetota bacterium]|nr:DNA polymerase III subunit alpha [Planctomycetota bacterium]